MSKTTQNDYMSVIVPCPEQFWGGEHFIVHKQEVYNRPRITSLCGGGAGPVEHVEQLNRGLRGGTMLFGIRPQH